MGRNGIKGWQSVPEWARTQGYTVRKSWFKAERDKRSVQQRLSQGHRQQSRVQISSSKMSQIERVCIFKHTVKNTGLGIKVWAKLQLCWLPAMVLNCVKALLLMRTSIAFYHMDLWWVKWGTMLNIWPSCKVALITITIVGVSFPLAQGH